MGICLYGFHTRSHTSWLVRKAQAVHTSYLYKHIGTGRDTTLRYVLYGAVLGAVEDGVADREHGEDGDDVVRALVFLARQQRLGVHRLQRELRHAPPHLVVVVVLCCMYCGGEPSGR